MFAGPGLDLAVMLRVGRRRFIGEGEIARRDIAMIRDGEIEAFQKLYDARRAPPDPSARPSRCADFNRHAEQRNVLGISLCHGNLAGE
jgi:hypothetical protein